MSTTITESIKKAMAELGIPSDEISLDEPKATKPTKKEVSNGENKPKEEPFMNPPVEESGESGESDEDAVLSVFCKVKGDKMVLFFPKDYPFEVTNFGDLMLNTLTFELPDYNNSKLQELSIILSSSQTVDKIVRTPIILPKEDKTKAVKPKTPSRTVDSSEGEDLDALTQRKAELDAQIKDARHNGDEELVNQLRKERRVVRGKINKLKAGE